MNQNETNAEQQERVRCSALLGVLQLKTKGGGILAIRKDAVQTVYSKYNGGRNLACTVNGIETEAGYDFVLTALGWRPEDVG